MKGDRKKMNKITAKKEGVRKIKGWMVAIIVIGAVFAAGAICCSIF
jgi:hypothetical protein